MDDDEAAAIQARRRARMVGVALVLIFVLPIVIGLLMSAFSF
ncbi:MAG: hypothetical protein AAF547_06365 [Actinomycetota bacterium]